LSRAQCQTQKHELCVGVLFKRGDGRKAKLLVQRQGLRVVRPGADGGCMVTAFFCLGDKRLGERPGQPLAAKIAPDINPLDFSNSGARRGGKRTATRQRVATMCQQRCAIGRAVALRQLREVLPDAAVFRVIEVACSVFQQQRLEDIVVWRSDTIFNEKNLLKSTIALFLYG
jgi:hypothetical protein